PRSASSFWMETVSGGCAICRRSAARRKLSVSARVTKWRMRRRSMGLAESFPLSITERPAIACTWPAITLPLEDSGALGQEGRHGFLVVISLMRQRLKCRCHFQQGVQTCVHGFTQQPLGQAHGMWRVGRDALGQLVGPGKQLIGRYHARDQAPARG